MLYKIKMERYEKIILISILISILIRISLLFLMPISFLHDALMRFIPNSFQILAGDFSFFTPPLFMLIMAGENLLFSGYLLEISWKLISFIFFILTLLLLPKLYSIWKLNNKEKVIVTSLFVFSTMSLLFGSAIMMEMMVLFLTIALFVVLEGPNRGQKYFLIALLSTLLLYTKQTAYFILAGFFLYTLAKKIPKKQKLFIFVALFVGFLLFAPWIIKNQVTDTPTLAGWSIGEILQNTINNFSEFNFSQIFKDLYYWFWMIQPFENVEFSGMLNILAAGYQISFLFVTAVLSFSILFGMIKFRKEYWRYYLLILPLFAIALIFGLFFPSPSDFGRYIFSFHIFFYLFTARFIESIKEKNIKRLFYVVIVVFVLLSIITAYGIGLHVTNREKEVNSIIERLDEDSIVISNDLYFLRNYEYAFNKPMSLDRKRMSLEESGVKEENLIYKTNSFKLFLKENRYYVYRKTQEVG